MNTFLTAEEILQLVTTGMVTLTEDLMIRMSESYEDSEWYNDPNNVMSVIIIESRRDAHTFITSSRDAHIIHISTRCTHHN